MFSCFALTNGTARAAGAVTVRRAPSGWEILGDASANSITVANVAPAVFDLNLDATLTITAGVATTLDGPATITLRPGESLRIALGAGDDVLRLGEAPAPAYVPGALRVEMGAGNDRVTGVGVTAGRGPLLVTGGLGNDVIDLATCSTDGRIDLRGLAGNDTISLASATAARGVLLDGGFGNDTLTATDVTSPRGLALRGGFGADTLRLAGTIDTTGTTGATGRRRPVLLDGGSENDQFPASGARILGPLDVLCGTGDDTTTFADVVVSAGGVRLLGGIGTDRFTLGIDVQTGALAVVGGIGDDTVTFTAAHVARDVFVDLGIGNDRLVSGGSSFGADVRFVGGPGADTLTPGAGDVVGGSLRTRGFETQN